MNPPNFLAALGGGVLIGSAAAMLMLFNGRIAGVSGMVRGLLVRDRVAVLERLLFLAGLVAGAALFERWSGHYPAPREHFPGLLLAAAGVLVGLGTGLARGCTSGHGVCGLARFSPRSMVAVGLFLSTAMVTTYLVRHVWGIA